MKQLVITEQEAKALIEELRKAWVTLDNQDIIFKMLTRLENELNK